MDPSDDSFICRIPRSCIIVADPSSKNMYNRPIDALAGTLLNELSLGKDSVYHPYIQHLPSANDLSLAGIGCTWTDHQLQRLQHEPTIEHFTKLRSQRQDFIQKNDSSRELAGWAYDLASSRALQGPFGRGGKVRAATVGTAFAFAMALLTPLLYIHNLAAMPFDSALPVLTSAAVLVNTIVSEEPELAMLPWIDIANHKSKSRLFLEYGLFHDGIVLKRDGEAEFNEDQSFSFINFDYGGASKGVNSDKLLGEYGFVEENNPNDAMDILVGKKLVTIGRRGQVLTAQSSLKDIKDAAKKVRDGLLDTKEGCNSSNDPVDIQRYILAAQWRKEKIRLLNEFL